jgi:antitoxin HigA-1
MFMRAVHPGEVLKDELDELGVAPTEFARQIDVPPNRVSQIIAGKRAVTGDTALRFGHWFGAEPQFWLNLQSAYEIRIAVERAGRERLRGCPCELARTIGRARDRLDSLDETVAHAPAPLAGAASLGTHFWRDSSPRRWR